MPAPNAENMLSTPEIVVGGVKVSIVPNSFSRTIPGESTVRWVSSGGTSGQTVRGLDAESLVGKCSFTLANTAANHALVEEWKSTTNTGGSYTIEASTPTKQFAFDQMVVVNAPEAGFEAEGDIEVEWEGRDLTV